MLTAEEFNTICNQLNDDQENILALRNPDGTLMEDVEDNKLYVAYRNNKYHGTGQYVGPYKKSMHGVADDGTPDISPKYVLDFDLDIWKTNEKHPVGKTFTPHTDTDKTEDVTPITPTTTTSADEIRDVLEKAGVHQRVLDVTSAFVEIDKNNPTIAYVTFPAGLIDKTEELPLGREWELVIEEGAFLDMAKNSFGENNASSKTEVKINTENGKAFFNSAGVATPVIRVDRYSYGLGIKQSDSSGKLTSAITSDSTEPTGFVRVRIDCETSEAIINYKTIEKSSSVLKKDDSTGTDGNYCTSNRTTTDNLKPSDLKDISLSNSYEHNSHFAGGSSSLSSSLKQYIIAEATENNLGTSEKGVEGIFKTVVHFVTPKSANKTEEAKHGKFHADWSIRGTTNKYSEPSISPFPLRDSPCGSPYLRRTYKSGSDYYWVSFEILIDSTFSGHGWARAWRYFYNWAKNWGLMWPGELTKCEGMENWE